MTARYFSPLTALSVIIANMIGTGVFTSLGFQLADIQSGFPLIMLWVAGGIAALCGAICYGELGAALPRSGGEYNFLSRIYHPGAGFVAGWVSAIIGFGAPIALAAMTFGAYARFAIGPTFPEWAETALAAGLVSILCLIHAGRRQAGGALQIGFTAIKVIAIVLFCAAAIWAVPQIQPVQFTPAAGDGALLTGGAFAVSLIYVSYAYTGWNVATYLSGELERPQRDLPRVLITGTLIVMTLYVALNAVFLMVAPMDEMVGQIEIGVIAAESAFGRVGGQIAGFALAILLISTVSAMTIAGPRVLQVVGEDLPVLQVLSKTNQDGVPSRAVYFQSAVALFFILTSSFDSVLVFSGFVLAFMSFLTVTGLFYLRWKEPDLDRPYRVSLFPIPPIIYLSLTGWTLIYVLIERPVEGLFGLGLIGSGLIVYLVLRAMGKDA
ncbi:MAG: amino acid permease [Henriciella sp.]|nr:amino acid permease [Henriciella sp.]